MDEQTLKAAAVMLSKLELVWNTRVMAYYDPDKLAVHITVFCPQDEEQTIRGALEEYNSSKLRLDRQSMTFAISTNGHIDTYLILDATISLPSTTWTPAMQYKNGEWRSCKEIS